MTVKQDPTHPTGVIDDSGHVGNSALSEARIRKAESAITLRRSGATWDEIAEVLGFPTGHHCQLATEKALQKALDNPEGRAFMRKLAGDRLDRLLRSVWKDSINEGSPTHLASMDRALKIIDRQAKLHGLDAPTEYVVSTPTAAEIERWVSEVSGAGTKQIEEADIFGVIEGKVVPDAAPTD